MIFGGRNGIGYFNDVWAYRLSTKLWEEWTPEGNAPSPMGRDHFGAVYDAGHVYIFGEQRWLICNKYAMLHAVYIQK